MTISLIQPALLDPLDDPFAHSSQATDDQISYIGTSLTTSPNLTLTLLRSRARAEAPK